MGTRNFLYRSPKMYKSPFWYIAEYKKKNRERKKIYKYNTYNIKGCLIVWMCTYVTQSGQQGHHFLSNTFLGCSCCYLSTVISKMASDHIVSQHIKSSYLIEKMAHILTHTHKKKINREKERNFWVLGRKVSRYQTKSV